MMRGSSMKFRFVEDGIGNSWKVVSVALFLSGGNGLFRSVFYEYAFGFCCLPLS